MTDQIKEFPIYFGYSDAAKYPSPTRLNIRLRPFPAFGK